MGLFCVEDGVDGGVTVWLIEDGAACHKHVGTAIVEFGCIGSCDSAVDFDDGVGVLTVDHIAEALNLAVGVFDEFLSAEAWVDAHEQYEVGFADNVFKEFYWCVRIEGDTGFHACIVDALEAAVEMCAGFVVYVHDFGAEGFDFVDEFVGFYDHEVHVEWFGAELCHIFQDREAEGDVGHEDSVHDVDMKVLCATLVDDLDIVGEVSEVG